MRTLYVRDSEGEFKVEIPDGARVTFGPNVPFTPKQGYNMAQGYSLRVYRDKGNDSLIAVFTNVAYFRDSGIPVARLVVRETGKSVWKSDEHGYEVQETVNKEKEYVDVSRQLESAFAVEETEKPNKKKNKF